jgi:hypothetical protein
MSRYPKNPAFHLPGCLAALCPPDDSLVLSLGLISAQLFEALDSPLLLLLGHFLIPREEVASEGFEAQFTAWMFERVKGNFHMTVIYVTLGCLSSTLSRGHIN